MHKINSHISILLVESFNAESDVFCIRFCLTEMLFKQNTHSFVMAMGVDI